MSIPGSLFPQLDNCAREPIRIPGGIQPHGALIVVDPMTWRVVQASANAAALLGVASAAGERLADSVGAALSTDLMRWGATGEAMYLRTCAVSGRDFQVSAHRCPQGIIVEFEAGPADDSETLAAVYPKLRAFVDAVGATRTLLEIAELAVKELRALTGFNRVMLYGFDATGDGTVVAECNDGELPSYLDLRFPASDIPAQARELYRSNRLRLIPNADYVPAPIEPPSSPVDGKPLDLSGAALRSVSPIHLEYMRNMGTGSSMSISVLVDGDLWGLISCHNRLPKLVNAQIRSACDFLGQIVSMQIGSRERAERAARRIELKRIEGELVGRLSQNPAFHDGIEVSGEAWLQMLGADGVAVLTIDGLTRFGLTPSEPELNELAAWLQRTCQAEVFETDSLAPHWPQAESFANVASGLLAVSISQLHPSYIMWFRQEVVRTVRWGGDPRKDTGVDRLHPRKSFEIWKQQVRLKSLPWSEVDIEGARDLRNGIINFVLLRAEERAALSDQLQRTNEELQTFSYSVSHDLRAPFRHIVGYAELLGNRAGDLDEKARHYLDSIVDSALHAGRLVDDLLAFSQVGRSMLTASRVDMRKLVAEVRRSREHDLKERVIEWRIGDLPPTVGDPSLLRQVWANLIDNAIKYTHGVAAAVIDIEGTVTAQGARYSVKDNGAGFEMAYVGKLFGIFQRLHRAEEFPGTGIGLALVKRIVERHGGSVSAEGQVGVGATVGFVLPERGESTDGGA